jgi:hypothetical protein
MFLFNSAEVYVGYSLDELVNIREILATDKIKYNIIQ